MKYELLEASLADLSRLYRYIQQGLYRAKYGLKGFDYPYIVSARCWKPGERVLDVGAGYSPLPLHLQEQYGSEVWVADDFGMKSGNDFWKRQSTPLDHIQQHPQVNYVLERLGDPSTSSLPVGYFDVIYSASALEHVPPTLMAKVWRHMDLLLKPGGEMLHAIDLPFPSNGGLKKVLLSHLFDLLYHLVPKKLAFRHCLSTPKTYTRLALSVLGQKPRLSSDLSVFRMVLDPDILLESYEHGLLRITKDGIRDYRYPRVGSLMLRLKKL
jgi:SAM-dependent methyltransferase